MRNDECGMMNVTRYLHSSAVIHHCEHHSSFRTATLRLELDRAFRGEPAQVDASVVLIDRRETTLRRGDVLGITTIAAHAARVTTAHEPPVAGAIAGCVL